MKDILVVFTGGTIGSSASQGVISPDASASYHLISLFQAQYPEAAQVNFHCIQPYQLLSENLAPPAWQRLIAAIEAENPERYAGVIVTHGTDTLAFTAAALSLYFNVLAVPILMVSSDYPLSHAKANGVRNFICAVDYIRQHQAAGVWVPYRNQGQPMHLHHGARLAASLQLSSDFISVQNRPMAVYDNRRFDWQEPLPARQPMVLKAEFSPRVVLIKPYPGLDYSRFNLQAGDVVLHDMYHSGTACSTAQWGGNFSLVEFVRQCRENSIPVYLAPAMKTPDAYASTHTLLQEGVTMIWNTSLEAAYVKLMLAYGNFSETDRTMAFLQADIAGEMII